MHGLLGVQLPLEEKQRTKIFFLILCESLSQSASRQNKIYFVFGMNRFTECVGDLRQVSQVKV